MGAGLKLRVFEALSIDFEFEPVFDEGKVDGNTLLRHAGGVGDRENATRSNLLLYVFESSGILWGDEQQVAVRHLFDLIEGFDVEAAPSHFSFSRDFQKRFYDLGITQNPNTEKVLPALWGPLDVVDEVIDESGLESGQPVVPVPLAVGRGRK